MSKRNIVLWWKFLVVGAILVSLSVGVGFFALTRPKPEAEKYVSFDTGEVKTFELTEPATLWLFETNSGLGSSPGRFRDEAEMIRLFAPDGSRIPLKEDRLGEVGAISGTFGAPAAGIYRLEADSVGQVESYGDLRGRRPYSLYRTLCDGAFFYVLPFGLGLILLGIVLGIIRGVRRMFFQQEKDPPTPGT